LILYFLLNNMKLSELVKLKNDLLEIQSNLNKFLTSSEELTYAQTYLNALSTLDFTFTKDICGFFDILSKEKNTLLSNLHKQIRQIEEKINNQSAVMLTRGYKINDAEVCSITSTEMERLNRIEQADPGVKNLVKSQIALKTSPRFPCLEIGPGDGQWTEYLVAADPLYLVDIHQEFLDSTINKFEPSYRPRVRPYVFVESEAKNHLLEKLPEGQFGFVFAWDVFSFFPADFFESYLNSIFKILKAGGTVMFNYNNCEIYQNAKYAETGFKSWMPKYLVEQIAKRIGYDIESQGNIGHVYWIILRKPGSLTTVKGMQGLRRIISF